MVRMLGTLRWFLRYKRFNVPNALNEPNELNDHNEIEVKT